MKGLSRFGAIPLLRTDKGKDPGSTQPDRVLSDRVLSEEAFGLFDELAGPANQGYSSFHDGDTSAEVDAAFRSQRRIALAYFVVFVAAVLGVAGVTVWSSWATSDLVLGGFSPAFLATAVGLYLFFVGIGTAAATLANGVDDRMLGAELLSPPSGSVNDFSGGFADGEYDGSVEKL